MKTLKLWKSDWTLIGTLLYTLDDSNKDLIILIPGKFMACYVSLQFSYVIREKVMK